MSLKTQTVKHANSFVTASSKQDLSINGPSMLSSLSLLFSCCSDNVRNSVNVMLRGYVIRKKKKRTLTAQLMCNMVGVYSRRGTTTQPLLCGASILIWIPCTVCLSSLSYLCQRTAG